MNKINWFRMILGGLVATVILFITDGWFHERVVNADWIAVYHGLGVAEPHHNAVGLVYFAAFDLGRGFMSLYLYALMRSCCGPGPKTAALAGVVAWIAFSITGPAQFIPLGFYSDTLLIKVGAFQLVTSIIAAIVGALLYQDAVKTSA